MHLFSFSLWVSGIVARENDYRISDCARLFLAQNFSTFCSYPETLPKTKIKNSRLINLVEEMSKQPNIQVMAWYLLAAVNHIYSECQEQTAELSKLKSLQFHQKESLYKAGSKDNMDAEKISTEKKASIVHEDNGKNALKLCQEISKTPPF